MRCGNANCECNKCSGCGEISGACLCGIVADTKTLLNTSDYTYEDFAHRARWLLERWLAKKTSRL